MKTKIALAVGVLLALVPMAAPKGRSGASLTFGATCDGSDNCTATASGLVAGKLYEIQVYDSCSGRGPAAVDLTADTSGNLSYKFDLSGYDGCTGADNWLFYLYAFGSKRLQTVATTQATEPN